MRVTKLLVIITLVSLLQACGSTGKNISYEWNQSPDPLEGLNRSVYAFNNTADKYVLRPVAKGYNTILPKPAKKGVSNFFANLGEPWSVVNNLLQGKVDHALSSTYRFLVNSTLGIAGLVDIAKIQGVERTPEDLGQTLATWGVKPGPYLMLPFLGPTNLRDGVGRGVSSAIFYPINQVTESANTRTALNILNVIDTRASLLAVDSTLDKQLDPYLFIKTALETSRTDAINDGNTEVDEEEFDF